MPRRFTFEPGDRVVVRPDPQHPYWQRRVVGDDGNARWELRDDLDGADGLGETVVTGRIGRGVYVEINRYAYSAHDGVQAGSGATYLDKKD